MSLRAEELTDFRDQLDRLLQLLTGEARLHHMEDQVGCTVRLKDGVGELEAVVREQIGAELRVSEVRTDQSYLQQSVRQLDAIVSAFPVKGDALAYVRTSASRYEPSNMPGYRRLTSLEPLSGTTVGVSPRASSNLIS